MKKAILIFLSVAATLALLYSGTRAFFNRGVAVAAADYESAVAAAKAAGIELEIENALPKPTAPELNAAPDYQAFSTWLRRLDKELQTAVQVVEQQKVDQQPATDAQLKANLALLTEGLALVRTAASKPECVFVRDWSHPASVLLPEYADMKRATKLLATLAGVTARRGETEEALAALGDIFNVAGHAKQEPILIAHLVAIALRNIGMQTALKMVDDRPELATNQTLRQLLDQPVLDLRRTVTGEIAMAMRTDFSDPSLDAGFVGEAEGEPVSTREIEGDLQKRVLDVEALNRGVRARMLRFWVAANPNLAPDAEPLVAHQALGRLEHEFALAASKSGDRVAKRTVLMLPVMGNLVEAGASAQIKKSIMLAVLDCVAHKTKTGAYPSDLSARPLIDPWTKQPMVYELIGSEGFRIRSVGPNGIDDAGQSDDVELSFPVSLKRKRS